MKKVIIFLLSFVIILTITLISIPYLFKDDIEKFIKEEVNNSVNAIIDYKDLNLSLISDFPNLHVKISDFTIDGIDEFENTRLIGIDRFTLSLDVKKLFIDENLEIKKIGIDGADINIKVLKNGKANYDIVKPDSDSDNSQKEEEFNVKIEKYLINKTNITYDDKSLNLLMKIKNLHQDGTGMFSGDNYKLDMQTSTDTLDVIFDDIHYISNAKTSIDNQLLIENDYSKYTVKEAEINLNNLELQSDLMFELKDNDILMDIDFVTQPNSLPGLLSLIPKAYMPDLKGLKTSGTAFLKGDIKGVFNEKNYPSYHINLSINNGHIQYPDLPESIENVNVITKIEFPGGDNLDVTEINIPKINFEIAGSKTSGKLFVKNLMTDPFIDTYFYSSTDLSNIKKAVSIPSVNSLSGILKADFSLKGKTSAIENQKFDEFQAKGFFDLKDFILKSDSIPNPVYIDRAEIKITPQALNLQSFDSKIGESDFHIKGYINNYISYFLKKDKILKADFNLHSNYLNINQFLTNEETQTKTDTTQFSVIKIPQNLDIVFIANANKVRYKDMDLNNVKGSIKIKDEKASMESILMQTLNGNVKLKGIYDTSSEIAKTSMNMSLEKVSFAESAQKISIFNNYLPAMKKINGIFFSDMDLTVQLDEEMNPIFSTLDAKGLFKTSGIYLNGIEVIKKIGNMLKINELSNPKIDKVAAQFEINKGKLDIKPFDFRINQIQSDLKGSISLDKKVNFILNMEIPRKMLGSRANQILEGLVGSLDKLGLKENLGDIIKMKFNITGDINQPKITPLIAGTEGKSVQDIVTQAVEDKVEEVVEDTKAKVKAEAQQQADKLMKKAQEQANQIVAKAKKLANKIREEADIQADEIIKKTEGNPFKKLAAETMAKKIKEEAYKKADKIETEAQNKANQILKQQKEKANQLINNIK